MEILEGAGAVFFFGIVLSYDIMIVVVDVEFLVAVYVGIIVG